MVKNQYKNKLIKSFLTTAFVFGLLFSGLSVRSVSAQTPPPKPPIPAGCPGSTQPPATPPFDCNTIPAGCPGSTLPAPPTPPDPSTCPYEAQAAGTNEEYTRLEQDCPPDNQDGNSELTNDNCKIVGRLLQFINVLSALVGLIVVAVIIIGGIQYSASGDNPSMMSAAKKRITTAIIALLLYLFMFAFLQYVIPGGAL